MAARFFVVGALSTGRQCGDERPRTVAPLTLTTWARQEPLNRVGYIMEKKI